MQIMLHKKRKVCYAVCPDFEELYEKDGVQYMDFTFL